MALVSSITPSTSLYPSANSIHARTTSDPSSPPSVLVRALPTPPPTSTSSSSRSMHASPVKSASGLPHLGQQAKSATPRTGGGGGGESYNNSQHAPRQGSSSAGYATTNGGGGGATSSSSAGGVGSSPSSNSVRLPSPLPPSRSASTPPATFQSTSSFSSSSPNRPTATPLPNQNGSYHHQHSSSSSSLPRISPAQYQQQQQQQQQQQNYMGHPQVAHPSFVGQPFSPFAPPHAFAHPAFPFVPSPHPNNTSNNYVSYSPNGQVTPGGTAEQQKRMHAFQQAQWAAAAGQMELLRNQQSAYQNQNQNGQDGRRRTTSGPAANHSPNYYTTPLPYPPSPSPSQYGLPSSGSTPSFPAGAMLPHFAANHGYPTPPGSTEGVVRGGESGGSSSGGSREGGYHPYRRDQHHHHQASKSSSSESGTRSSSTPRSHSTTPSTSSIPSRVAVPKITAPSPQQPQQNRTPHSRTESSQSSQAYHSQSIPRSHTSSPSITSVRSLTLPSSSSTSQLPSPAYASRPRTQSANSSSSSLHRQQFEQPQAAAPLPRQPSFESARSSTPHAQNRPRPSPLGGVHQPLPVDSDEESDDGIESDGTAEATATVNQASKVAAPVSRSPTMNSMATIKTTAPAPVAAEKGKEKEKKGMASRFKKAFGGGSSSNSSSATTLTERELDGRGPVQPNGGFRPRHDSVSSSETSTNPRTPPSAHTSQPSIASMASSSSRTMNGDADSTRKAPSSRFRLLNSKLNSSTDNISISSTVSSASVMIRKLGQMGKLARRNSLMGLTKAFKKDKNKDDAEEDPIKTPGKKDKKNKSGASLASVSHATAEVESSPHQPGMSPAAALAKKQQAHYAEQEAAEAKAREEAAKLGPPQAHSHGRTDSDGASVKSGKSGRWGIGRSKTTDDADQGRQKALEKEKDKLKSRNQKGSKGGFRLGFGGSKTDLNADAGSIIHNDDASSIAGTERGGGSALGLYRDGDTTPRQSLEILAPPQSYATYGQETVRRDSSSDYEPSLYRQGAVPPSQNPRSVKGILKGAGTYSQDHYARPRPGFHRNRASSFDAPQQQGRPGSPGGAALVNVIPSQAQVDGVAPSSTSARVDTHPPTSTEQIHDSAISRVEGGGGGVYSNPSMNASAPVLTQFAAQTAIRSNSAPGATGRRIAFAANLSVHTTWPAAIYDRRAEPATCNRLTPTLAQQIKEELNSFKMEEMDVHPDSRKLTHFFV